MIKYDYNYPDYLIQKIEISDNTNLLPHKQEFRSALHQIYFSNNSGKINEIVNSLTAYYCRHEKLVHQEAFKKALKDLNDYSEGSDKFFKLKDKKDNIQGFFKNVIERTFN